MERLNATQRRVFILAECVKTEAEIWPMAEELEKRAKACFPSGWSAEIRISYGSNACPAKCYRVMAYSDITLKLADWKVCALNPLTSKPELGCWITRTFKIT